MGYAYTLLLVVLFVALCLRSVGGKEGSISKVGDPMEGVEVYGVSAPSAIGSKARENVELDELGVSVDDRIVVATIISGEAWPSKTDCFRAWGWFDLRGSVFERESGDDIWGEAGA